MPLSCVIPSASISPPAALLLKYFTSYCLHLHFLRHQDLIFLFIHFLFILPYYSHHVSVVMSRSNSRDHESGYCSATSSMHAFPEIYFTTSQLKHINAQLQRLEP